VVLPATAGVVAQGDVERVIGVNGEGDVGGRRGKAVGQFHLERRLEIAPERDVGDVKVRLRHIEDDLSAGGGHDSVGQLVERENRGARAYGMNLDLLLVPICESQGRRAGCDHCGIGGTNRNGKVEPWPGNLRSALQGS